MKIIFFGAPGAGKGTQADIVSQKLHIPTISTGAIIREAIKEETPMGIQAKSYIERGELAPDEVVIGIIKERLSQGDCDGGYILDGFPRTISQAQALEKMGVDIDAVLELYVPDAQIVERMSGRRVCPKCGATYHTKYNPSGKGEDCEKCGEKLSIRKDDAPEVVKSRLEVYHNQTEPLKEHYGKQGILKTVVGQEQLQDTTALTLAALGI